ncbi:type II secretion system F family protein [Protofrankia symbiont of Coriaria ruscifolia]|uniref:type II secretion system F family protein n=1 Tax=Protofrankia symbiont of Coriaria ruscifolia TaxID=1306542 RepID=UPI001040FEE1|nr:type II secretion system F family protein [Protofrankia symbiont of Coriaria ruscifolia]
MSSLPTTVLPALCGALAGAGVFLTVRTLLPAPSGGESRADRAGSTPAAAAGWAAWIIAALTRLAGQTRTRRLLLADDLALADRDQVAHTAVRIGRGLAGSTVMAALAAGAAAAGLGLPFLLLPAGCLFGGLLGVLSADRPVRRLAAARRQETRLAVAAFIDLLRILLVGGLPLHAALTAAVDSGGGWAFEQIRDALDWARTHRVAPDAGLDRLATRIPAPEFTDLRLTISSALRGASPVQALQSKAVHMRAAEAAQARTESATADAEMELPAAVVALAFVAFLTFPLLMILTRTGTGL